MNLQIRKNKFVVAGAHVTLCDLCRQPFPEENYGLDKQ